MKVLDLFDTRPERDNVWVVTDTRWLPDGHEYKPYGQWYWPTYPEAYDYAWRWLTEEERATVRKVIARLQADRYTHFMELPTSRQLINHASMAMLWMSYPLVIEGEEGYNKSNYEFARKKYEEVLEYYISPDGTMYENVKGFLPWQIYLAIARRENGKILQHPHIFNHMRRMLFTAKNAQNDYINWSRPPIRASAKDNAAAAEFYDPRGGINSRSWELHTSGHPLALFAIMNWFYPNRKDFDFIIKSYGRSCNFDFFLDKSLKTWMPEVGLPALILAFATDGVADKEGKPIDWSKTEVDFEKKTAYADLERGVCE
ncbi:MAG: hypothetical protein HY801_12885, partial [Candidatus Lindowbacteria bacterium]|nr:hypothetical protein [Candidatus Lindowbacteria bacterium]